MPPLRDRSFSPVPRLREDEPPHEIPDDGGELEALRLRVARLEEELAATERAFALAMDGAPIGMALLDLDGCFLRVNEALCTYLGRTADELLMTSVHEVSHPDDLVRHLDLLGRTLAGELPGFRLEKRYLRPNGTELWGELSVALVRDELGRPLYCVAQTVDITDRKAEEDRLRRQAQHDPLTGLRNRASADAALRHELRVAAAGAERVGVLFIDLDRFKPVNDEHGHAAGDVVLRAVASRLRDSVRPGDTAARLGGDEFLVVAPHMDEPGALALARRILERIREPIELDGAVVSVEASIGVHLAWPLESPGQALVRADEAMYEAKQDPRVHVVISRP